MISVGDLNLDHDKLQLHWVTQPVCFFESKHLEERLALEIFGYSAGIKKNHWCYPSHFFLG